MTIRLRTLAIALAVLLAIAASGGALFVYLGVYDIAATKQHTRPVFALMDYAMRRAVKARGDPDSVPDLREPRRVDSGLALYRAHCLQCHGAPGVAPDPLAFGLTPAPANLVGTVRQWPAHELFWVIKHGIKMTGMPAWAYRLSDEEMWDLVAFLQAMTAMTPRDYEARAAGVPRAQARADAPASAQGSAGDAAAGRRAAAQYLCATCHVIPGFVSAQQHVGPPLSGMAGRAFIGGIAPNTPENMVRWLKNPRELDPQSAMPALGLSDRDARDIAAFLYTLEDVNAK